MPATLHVLSVCVVCVLALAGVARCRTISGLYVSVDVGDAVFDVSDFGAAGDGATDDTAAVQKAFAAAAAAGGGTVLLSRGGTYLVKALAFQSSHTALEVSAGSTLRVSNDRAGWPAAANVIAVQDVHDVALVGAGTMDGQGRVWWEHRDEFRPKFVYAKRARNVVVAGLTWRDPPDHCLQLYADNAEVFGVTMRAPPSTGVAEPSHNTDGVDAHGTPFYVHDCDISVGDDNVAVHANDTLVEDCVFGSGHGASVGSLAGAWLRNVTFRRIKFNGTTAGARIKTVRGSAGELRDVLFESLEMHGVKRTVDITMLYELSPPPSPGARTTFRLHDVELRDIRAYGSKMAGNVLCDADSPCWGIRFRDVEHWPADRLSYNCTFAHGSAAGTVTPLPELLPE
eukprot:m51a1_g4423 hypothetical protein (398) ;mRNA; f:53765-54958